MSLTHAGRQSKSPFERWRTRLTALVFFPLWAAILLATRAEGFETKAYKVLEYFGFFLICIAVMGRLWCSLYISGRKDRQLCVLGPYSISRNPLYFFSFVGVVGICAAAQNITLAVFTGSLFLIYYHFIIGKEEARLREMFGIDFERYVSSVPRFLPRLDFPTTEDTISLSVKPFIRSLTEVIWFLIAVVAIEIIEDLRRGGFLGNWVWRY
jgi:protein-S-isoprenylcysteine O-methyltransferase Ste14